MTAVDHTNKHLNRHWQPRDIDDTRNGNLWRRGTPSEILIFLYLPFYEPGKTLFFVSGVGAYHQHLLTVRILDYNLTREANTSLMIIITIIIIIIIITSILVPIEKPFLK